ncbi:MAG: MFS transporter [Candidatus Dormibacteria bacterium]
MRPILAASAIVAFLAGYSGSILFIALPAIAAEFHASVPGLATVGATLALGTLVALPLAARADRRHRGEVATMSIVGFSGAAVVSAIAPSLAVLGAARLLAVGCETIAVAIATSAVVECAGARNRGKAVALLAVSGGAGGALVVVAYPFLAPHWRALYAMAGLGLPLASLAMRIPSPAPVIGAQPGLGGTFEPAWRARLAVLCGAAALASLLFEPANFFSVLFGSRRLAMSPLTLSLVVAVSGVAALVGYAAGGWASDRYGRRVPSVVLLGVGALFAALSFNSSPLVYGSAAALWSAGAGAAAPMMQAWCAELVPARARVSALTATSVAAAAGGVVGLRVVAALEPGFGLPAALWFTAAAAIAGSLMLLALPETRGMPLAD